ncbi:hypothetical protein [Aphanothece hegewaldii]|uniref:hypothetical protein n=1 Tax=Aphanothece hegewaldii TaxID=1521625 RepID=UPI001C6296B6|nr:hypothetical protein [Aphanothece hegewaldii]
MGLDIRRVVRPLEVKVYKANFKLNAIFAYRISNYYQDNHSKFTCTEKEAVYWLTLLERLKALSSLTAQELLVNRSSTLRCHPINWEDTSENGFGLPNEEQLVDTPYQFSLSSNEHGRVHGFFIDDVFYIVWLDPQHLLYPEK